MSKLAHTSQARGYWRSAKCCHWDLFVGFWGVGLGLVMTLGLFGSERKPWSTTLMKEGAVVVIYFYFR